jgi:flagellar FliL protein
MSSDASQAADAPKKSKKSLLLGLVIVGGILVGGGAGAFMAGPLLAGSAGPKAAAGAADAKGAEGEHGSGAEDGDGAEHAPGVVHLVENLVLNPARTGGSRFLLVTVGFAVQDEAAAKLLTDRDPELRDAIIRFFGARGVDELGDIAQRDSFKVQLRAAVAERFGSATVREIYFPQFVIQ